MRKKHIELQDGCSRTEVFISPKNYKSIRRKSEMPKYWFVECRFFDPKFLEKYPNGFQFRKKFSGNDLQELKITADAFKQEMETLLDEICYNPLTKSYMNENLNDLHPGLFFVEALEKTYEKLKPTYRSAHHGGQIRLMIARIKKIQISARLEFMKISEIRTHHIKNLLDRMKLTNSVYNKFRAYLMSLFKELVQYGCADSNYIREISKREEVPAIRKVLTPEKFDLVFNYLKENQPEFFRYAVIFHYSGARSSELMRLRRHDVDIDNKEFRVLIKKGPKQAWETKAIIPAAVPYWESLLSESIYEDEFLFSYFQCPGDVQVSPGAITQKWYDHVKKSNKIKDSKGDLVHVEEDFYSLKHLFLQKLDAISEEKLAPIINLAQRAASHRTARTTSIYTGKTNSAELNILKHVDIS